MVACDFCGQRAAILYCRADTAKLCLSCDQHVHSANALSRKHLRSQICDNCAAGPASVRCATDGLVLCQECDWDAHGSCAVSAAHDRCPLEGFSGCPSPLDLAAAWDSGNAECGEEVGPRTPSGGGWRPESVCEEQQLLEEKEQPQQHENGGFTSLLMMETKEEVNNHSSQIWDFNLGKLRSHDESGNLELDDDVSDMLYTVKSYGELLKEVPLSRRRGLDLSEVNNLVANEDIILFNVRSYFFAHLLFGPASSECNNFPVSKPSFLGFPKPKSGGSSKDPQFTDQPILVRGEHVSAMTNADLELLAKNRDNAMQRYKEKKKARRYDKHIRYESRKARADTRKRQFGHAKGRRINRPDGPLPVRNHGPDGQRRSNPAGWRSHGNQPSPDADCRHQLQPTATCRRKYRSSYQPAATQTGFPPTSSKASPPPVSFDDLRADIKDDNYRHVKNWSTNGEDSGAFDG
ncbi:Zinc finger protein CONSTANS-LIKE 14 [Striga hermonthica]|uniref:Zinc finger protein CONSTANS-LIKE 14 n=1 Tax=Striga hermonthica TaxID=68872 RepID=A0A9N7NIY9_STRHE|nr:Zinc finger protein CONSTANS-LIKE 14 [Striga hermonthica]